MPPVDPSAASAHGRDFSSTVYPVGCDTMACGYIEGGGTGIAFSWTQPDEFNGCHTLMLRPIL
jgi:hypothetical protein